MRIDNLAINNGQTQGVRRRAWLREHAPEHLEHCERLMLRALALRQPSASQSVLILGAGACTEVPLERLTRAADELVLADLDVLSMGQARSTLAAESLRRRIRLQECDISGGVSARLRALSARLPWERLISEGAPALFDALAACLDQCLVPDPPQLPTLVGGEFGLVISDLLLSQLFSYPLLDLLDEVQQRAPAFFGEQERHRRYFDAAQAFRTRIIQAHLHLLAELVDRGGAIALLSDVRGFVFNVQGTEHDTQHRRELPLVPWSFFDLVPQNFTVVEEEEWEWLTDLPDKERPGRGYQIAGYVLTAR